MTRLSYAQIRRELFTRREDASVQCIANPGNVNDCPNDLWPEQVDDATELFWRAEQNGLTLDELRNIINCLLCVRCQSTYTHKNKVEDNWRNDFPELLPPPGVKRPRRCPSPNTLISGQRKGRQTCTTYTPNRSCSRATSSPLSQESRLLNDYLKTPPQQPRFISARRQAYSSAPEVIHTTAPIDISDAEDSSDNRSVSSGESNSDDDRSSGDGSTSDDGAFSDDEGISEDDNDHEILDSPSVRRYIGRTYKTEQAAEVPAALESLLEPAHAVEEVDELESYNAGDIHCDAQANNEAVDADAEDTTSSRPDDNSETVVAVAAQNPYVEFNEHDGGLVTVIVGHSDAGSSCQTDDVVPVNAEDALGTFVQVSEDVDAGDGENSRIDSPHDGEAAQLEEAAQSHLFAVGAAFTWAPWYIRSRVLSILLEPLPNGSIYAIRVRNSPYLKIGLSESKVQQRWSAISKAHKVDLETEAGFHISGIPCHELKQLEALVHADLAYFQRSHRIGKSGWHHEYFETDLATAQRSINTWWRILQLIRSGPGQLLDIAFREKIQRAALVIETSVDQGRAIPPERWSEVNSNHALREGLWKNVFEVEEDADGGSSDGEIPTKSSAFTVSWPILRALGVPTSLACLAVGGVAFILGRRKLL